MNIRSAIGGPRRQTATRFRRSSVVRNYHRVHPTSVAQRQPASGVRWQSSTKRAIGARTAVLGVQASTAPWLRLDYRAHTNTRVGPFTRRPSCIQPFLRHFVDLAVDRNVVGSAASGASLLDNLGGVG